MEAHTYGIYVCMFRDKLAFLRVKIDEITNAVKYVSDEKSSNKILTGIIVTLFLLNFIINMLHFQGIFIRIVDIRIGEISI